MDGAHCKDDDNDVMCYTSEATFTSGGIGKFDWNNDDYWDARADVVSPVVSKPNLGWWAVNLGKFVCPPVVGGTTPDCTSPNSPDYSYPDAS